MKQVGILIEVRGPIIQVRAAYLPPIKQVVSIVMDSHEWFFEVFQHLDEFSFGAIALSSVRGLSRGLPVWDTDHPLELNVCPQMLGRLLNYMGEPLDGGKPLPICHKSSIHKSPPP